MEENKDIHCNRVVEENRMCRSFRYLIGGIELRLKGEKHNRASRLLADK